VVALFALCNNVKLFAVTQPARPSPSADVVL